MTAAELVRVSTTALFAVVAVAAMAAALKHRRRPQVDAALLFGALGLVLVQGEATRALGVSLPPLVADLSAGLVVALPYLLLRLVDDLRGVPVAARRAVLAGLVLSVAGLIAAPASLPVWLTLGIIGYFVAAQLYASALLAMEARRSSGVARGRSQAGVAGSVLLGLAVLAAGAQTLLPIFESVTRSLALLSALAYFAGFATPGILKRAWREPHLRSFLERIASISPATEPQAIVTRLEEAAALTLGAAGAAIALREERTASLRFGSGLTIREGEGIAGRTLMEQRAIVSDDLEGDDAPHAYRHRDLDVRVILAAPMNARGRRIGALVVYMRRMPLFLEDDLALVRLLAGQAALVIDSARAYGDLAAVNRALAEATRAKSEFLSSMSHELRTPLNAILGFTELLTERLDEQLTPQHRRYFENIKSAGDHLLALINDVLDLSKVEAGRIELHPDTVALTSVVEPTAASARQDASERGIAFDAHIDPGAIVRLDAGRVRQILYNLLSNAVKFTDPGGRIRLSAGVNGGDLLLEVSDTGIGIPADRRDRLFGTFERLHEGRSEASGTGLGLALTKRLAELLGGGISFESEEGRGTTFRVRLPSVSVTPMNGERLLVVEDVERDAELIVALADDAGLRCEVVRSALGAREAIRRSPPRGIVLDLRLPDDRGERVLEAVKADPRTARIPVIVVTIEDDAGTSRPLGADDHITKPIDRERLARWLRAIGDRTTSRA